MDAKVIEAVSTLKRHISDQPHIGIILGSGLGGLLDEIENPVSVRFEDIPHHRGEVLCGTLCGACLLALSGRVHYYEGYAMQQVVFPIRVMAAFDVKTVIVTSSVGAINAAYKPGNIVAIRDHINFMGGNPLKGSNDFVDLTAAYSRELRNLARQMADRQGITLRSGVYAAYSGPSYETPAEIRALRTMGADMVGMSTVPEVIQANSLGMKVLGLSMITNMAAGMSAKPLSHQDVIKTSKKASAKFGALVKAIIGELERREIQ
jgi:purine-nucleoside phosphorylase